METRSQDRAKSLDTFAHNFARRLRQEFPEAIANSPRDFKKQVIRLIRRELPPRPGRPLDEAVTRATEMRAKGQPWSTIYCQCIPGYDSLDPGDRQLTASRLRTAMRTRRYR